MTINAIISLLKAQVLCGTPTDTDAVECAFASDLMSDVLTIRRSDFLLITGLANTQSIRTAEMSDLKYILLVRGKEANDEMIELAQDNGIILLRTSFSMFKTSGILYQAGLTGVY